MERRSQCRAPSGTLVVEQLSSTGDVVATTTQSLAALSGPFGTVTGALTVADGATHVRVMLVGGVLGRPSTTCASGRSDGRAAGGAIAPPARVPQSRDLEEAS